MSAFIRLIWLPFPSTQTQSGQTEALIEKDTSEKTGDYMHECSSTKTQRYVWVFVDCLRRAHICLPLLRSPLHAESHQQQSQGSHPLRRWVIQLTLIWPSANNGLMNSAFKVAFQTLVCDICSSTRKLLLVSYSLASGNLSFHFLNISPINYSLLWPCWREESRCFKALTALLLDLFAGSYGEGESFKDQLEWKNGQGQAFAQGGFQLVNNQIVIPKPGLYFVYSQASFRVSCSDGDQEGAGKRLTPLSHRIWRYSDSVGSKASLMSAVRSACQNTALEGSYNSGQGWYNTIYLGAVFQLNRGDRLWTETNQLSELETDEGKTFFGVFALWNDSQTQRMQSSAQCHKLFLTWCMYLFFFYRH